MKNSLLISAISSTALILLLFLFPSHSSAQKFFTAETTYAVKLGRTKPLYDIMPMNSTDSLKLKEFKSGKPKFVPNFGGRRHLDRHRADALPQGADPLFNPSHLRLPTNEILPKLVFEGINEASSNSGVPDVNGDIGRDYYVEIVNATHFRVFDKSGQSVSGLISANSIWSQVQQTSAGDPILLYDQEVDRWFLTEFPSNNRVLLAISLTGDPRGAWDAYAFQTPRFPDFPKYGIWRDAYYLTTNEGGQNYPIYAFNRADILAGVDVVRMQRLTVPKNNGVFFEVGQPVDWDGMNLPPAGSPGLVVKLHDDDWGTTDHDHIILHKISIDWDTAAKSNIELIDIPTAPYDTDGCSMEHTGGFSCVPQPNGQGIDGAQWIITNRAQYRNFGTHESFVMCFMVDVTGDDVAGIRWMEFRKTALQDWHLYQEGTIGSDDGLHRFMSSIGIDGQGNIGIAYSVSGLDKHPSLRYTGRYSSDPPGVMTFEEFEFATGGGSLGTDRYGDYASMSVDPADDQTFWFAGEYVPTNGNWSTKIVAFSASRDSFDIFPVSLISPQNSHELNADETVSISILNRGLNPAKNFTISYQFENGTWLTENATTDSLKVDSFYVHTFTDGIDFPVPGNYTLRLASDMSEDRNRLNDTLTFIVTRYAIRDVALEYNVPSNSLICSDNFENSIDIRNLGVEEINSILFEIYVNGVISDTVEWNGQLPFAGEEDFLVNTSGLNSGDNFIEVKVLAINGMPDEIPLNNQLQWTITAKPEGEPLMLNLLTDNYPDETTWELIDSDHMIIANGGPYNEDQTLFVSPFCLDKNECYTFIVYDAFGDGMSAQGVQGDYEILNMEGEVIAELSSPNFGDEDVNEFCLSGQCILDLQVVVDPESAPGAGDAFVMGIVTSGLGQILYSIDGFNFQSANTFSNLSPGDYTMIATDGAGCSDTASFTVLTCQLQTLITTLPASGGDVGEIHIYTIGGQGDILHSLNGGAFVSDTFFRMLEPGNYIVTTKDSAGCERTDSVTISTTVGTTIIDESSFIRINPNPGKGVYQIEASFNTSDIFVEYDIYNSNGEKISQGTLAKYNEGFKGEMTLLKHAAGIYYLVFYPGQQMTVRRVIKI